jgi:Ca2+:H+ antiporter
VPAVLGVSLATGQRVELGLDDSGVVLLTLTLAVSILTFSATRTNILQGAVHLILLLAYLMLIFAP